MCATILHGSLSSSDAVAAVSESDNCLAKAGIVVTCPASSGDGVVSMATLRKGLFPCSRGIQNDGANNLQFARTIPNFPGGHRRSVQDLDI